MKRQLCSIPLRSNAPTFVLGNGKTPIDALKQYWNEIFGDKLILISSSKDGLIIELREDDQKH